jgi:hypothetical protein
VSIDVTTVVRELLANEDYDGFLVSLPPFDGRGLTLDDMERFAEFSGAELGLTYTKTGPAPRRVQGSDKERTSRPARSFERRTPLYPMQASRIVRPQEACLTRAEVWGEAPSSNASAQRRSPLILVTTKVHARRMRAVQRRAATAGEGGT